MDSTYVGKLLGHLAEISWEQWAILVSAGSLVWFAGTVTYNLFFHPLRHFPGPKLWAASTVPWAVSLVRGRLIYDVLDMHETYGPVVRIRPSELAFASADAWQDIYGHKVLGKKAGLAPGIKELPKFKTFYKAFDAQPESIVSADREKHVVYRKVMAPGFSDKSMRAQEPIITGYIDLLMSRLRELSEEKEVANVTAWYNWTTFDVIGDLAFGESFSCLENRRYHTFVGFLLESPKEGSLNTALRYLNFKTAAMVVFFAMLRKGLLFRQYAAKTLKKRMELKEERFDLIGPAISKQNDGEWDLGSLQALSTTLMIAGSETTAASLAGVTWLLLKNPEKLRKLTEEVRGAFASESEITFASVTKLPYLQVCLTEGLRRYPPAAGGMPRITPEGGATIAGRYVPQNTVVSVYQLSANHLESNWTDPWSFQPERFLDDEKFSADNKESMKPFSLGPRDCIGKNLAYNEMRTILARMVWNFDMRLAEDSENWLEGQENYTLWKKPDLNVYLTIASR